MKNPNRLVAQKNTSFYKLFLLIAFLQGHQYLFAQSPGGVSGAALWFKADAGTSSTTNGAAVTSWTNQVAGTLNLSANHNLGAANPTYVSLGMNFNPAVSFLTNAMDTLPAGGPVLGNSTVFVAGIRAASVSSFSTIWNARTSNNATAWMPIINNTAKIGSATYVPAYTTTATTLSWSVGSSSLLRQRVLGTSAFYAQAGAAEAGANTTTNAGINTAGAYPFFAFGNNASTDATNKDNEAFGTLPETIVYSTASLTAAQTNRIESYLALKYGITLNQTTAQNYTASDGLTKMWDASAAATGFKNDIFGIGKDAGSALDQKISQSTNTGGGVLTIATTNNFVLNNLDVSRTSLSDLNFETIANNAGAATWTNTNTLSPYSKLTREWQVQETGSVGAIIIQFDVANASFDIPALTAGSSYYLFYDADGDGNYANATATALTPSGNLWSTSIDFAAGSKFTIATLSPFAGSDQTICVSGTPSVSLAGASTTGTWTAQTGNPAGAALGATTAGAATVNFTNAVVGSYNFIFTDGSLTDTMTVFGQSCAGGVSGASIWLKGDLGVTSSSGNVSSWADQSGNARNGTPVSTCPYNTATGLINFNPTVNTNNKINIGGTTVPFTNSTNFVVGTRITGAASHCTVWCDAGGNTQPFNINVTGNAVGVGNSGTNITSSSYTWAISESSLMQETMLGTAYSFSKLGGTASAFTSSLDVTGFNYHHIGNGGGTAAPFGNIAEIVVYPTSTLTTAQSQQINSYMATKYGLSLVSDYISPLTGTYFNTTSTNAGYANNIAIIGRETGLGLDQEQSFSGTAAVPVFMGANNTIAATNLAHGTSLADGSYEAFGSNNLSATISAVNAVNATGALGSGLRMAMVWKVQETGTVGSVMIAVPSSVFNASPCNSYLVVNSSDPTFAAGNTSISSSGTQTINGVACTKFTVDFTSGQYFTFAQSISTAPGLVTTGNAVSGVALSPCSDASAYNAYVDNAATPTQKYMAIQANGNNLTGVAVSVSNNNSNAAVGTTTNATALSSNMYYIDNSANGSPTYTNAMKVRVYFNPQDTVDAWTNATAKASSNLSTNTKSMWFKFEGNPAAVAAAQVNNGITGATYLTPTYGIENGVNYAEFGGIFNFSTLGFMAFNTQFTLPINLELFTGTRQGSNNLFQWNANNAVSFAAFKLQRAGTSNGSFTTIATISYNNGQSNYNYTDLNVSANAYYRLALVDIDGKISYSNTLFIPVTNSTQSIKVSPNPASGGMANITLTGYTGSATGRLYDFSGKVMITTRLTNGNTAINIANLAKGIYNLVVTDTNGNTRTEKILVQ